MIASIALRYSIYSIAFSITQRPLDQIRAGIESFCEVTSPLRRDEFTLRVSLCLEIHLDKGLFVDWIIPIREAGIKLIMNKPFYTVFEVLLQRFVRMMSVLKRDAKGA